MVDKEFGNNVQVPMPFIISAGHLQTNDLRSPEMWSGQKAQAVSDRGECLIIIVQIFLFL